MKIDENVDLAPLTTLQVGGSARYFTAAHTIAEVQEAVAFASTRNLPIFLLGGGSNLVISDKGWLGMVLKIAIPGIDKSFLDTHCEFEVGAGENWDDFVAQSVAHDCSGIECLSGIPGSVGGTPVQNVGAYGQQVADTIASVLVLDLRDGQVRELCAEACAFGYRTSIFNTTERGRFVILRVTFRLLRGGEPHIEYADLRRYFAERKTTPTLAETRDAVLQIRQSKAMLIRPGDEDSRSAGSFFKNPVVSPEQYEALTERARQRDLHMPSYPELQSKRKVSAAWLVENAGFHKGYTQGAVGISRKHALAIVNLGSATAADILAFKNQIQQQVKEVWGLQLEAEPVFVGF
jgi:UDP-N-acetylmuramate dehydrogenase